MKFTRLVADNVLSFEHAELDLDDSLTVIIGPNGAGKTNLARLVALVGAAFEWIEERSAGRPSPDSAQAVLKSYAASRYRGAAPEAVVRLELGIQLAQADLEELACFLRAAIVSTIMTKRPVGEKGPALASWAAGQVTADKLAALAEGTLFLEHEGPPDAPWWMGYEFSGDGAYSWMLADHPGDSRDIATGCNFPAGNQSPSDQLLRALLGLPLASRNPALSDPLPDFDLGRLCPDPGSVIETPLVQVSANGFDPSLEPHRRFAELVGLPTGAASPKRVYSLASMLRLAFLKGVVFVGEQLRGWPSRLDGEYRTVRLTGPPSWTAHALSMRLLDMKTGSEAQRERFAQVQKLFTKLAPGFQVDARRAGPVVTVLDMPDVTDPTRAPRELEADQAGAGVWEALVVAEALAEAQDRVVVLDEPALTLHPGWQRLLLQELRQAAGQVILITHSPYLVPLDQEADLFRLVRAARVNGATALARIRKPPCGRLRSERWGRDAASMIREFSLSADARALLFATGAVLLEGDTELGALPVWFEKSATAQELGTPGRLHLGFYAVGSETHFETPLRLLASLRIPWVIVCDGAPFRPHMGRNHIFEQVARAGAAPPGLDSFINSRLNHSHLRARLTFEDVAAEGRKHGIFTLAPGWTRGDKATGFDGDESFEAFAETVAPGKLTEADRAVGRGSKVRRGRWLAENTSCPEKVDRLYRELLTALGATGVGL